MTLRWFFVLSCLVFLVFGLAMIAGPQFNWSSIVARLAGSDHSAPDGWDVLVVQFRPFADIAQGRSPAPPPQGRLLVADVRITNKQQAPSSVTLNDFVLRTDDGYVFRPGLQTASVDPALVLGRLIQPGESLESRVVFDVDPPFKSFTLTALQTEHRVRVP